MRPIRELVLTIHARLPRLVIAIATAAMVVSGISPSHATVSELIGVVRVAGRAAKDVVVWLEIAGGPSASPTRKIVLDQRNMQFVPRVLAVRVGAAVDSRARFIVRTYNHLFGAIVLFTLLEIGLFKSGMADVIAPALGSSC